MENMKLKTRECGYVNDMETIQYGTEQYYVDNADQPIFWHCNV